MNSPSSYGDLELDSEVLNELAVIEATHFASASNPVDQRSPFEKEPPLTNPGSDDVFDPIASTSSLVDQRSKKEPLTNSDSDDLFDPTFDMGIQDLEELDAAIEDAYRRKTVLHLNHPLPRQLVITSRGDGKSPRSSSPDKPRSSRRGTQKKSPKHSIDHKVEKLDHIAFVKSGAKGKRKARDSDEEGDDEEGDEEGEMDTQRRPVSKRQRGQGQTRHPCKPPSHEVQHINAVTDADTCSGIDSDDPIDFL